MKLEPMLASPIRSMTTLDDAAALPGWSFERKLDGIRVLLCHEIDGHTRLLTRTGRDIARKFPEVVADAKIYGNHRIILDGELTFIDPALGLSALVGRMNSRDPIGRIHEPARLNVFDVLAVGGDELTSWTLAQRREVLGGAIADSRQHIVRVQPIEDKAGAWDFGRAQGWEGLVIKRLDSVYRPGFRADTWLKRKYRYELRVLAYELVSGSTGYGSVKVGVLDAEDKLVPIGTVGSGLTERHMRSLIAGLEYGRASPVVISCMGRTAGGLREPVFLRFSSSPLVAGSDNQLDELPTY